MDFRSLLVPDSKSAKLINPGKTSFHYPSPPTKTTAVFGVAHREQRDDATVRADLAELPLRHNRDRPVYNQAGGVDVPAVPAVLGWHQRARWLAASRYDSRQ
jgi:hypothetical protein